MKDTRYPTQKKRFDGSKKSSYLCKRNREESKKVPEVRITRLSHQMVSNPDDSSLNNMVVVAQEPKRFTVEQGSEQSCASGSTPLPTTKVFEIIFGFFFRRFGRH